MTRDLRLVVHCDSAAFDDDEEVPRILRYFANYCERGLENTDVPVFDINGNKVGTFKVTVR